MRKIEKRMVNAVNNKVNYRESNTDSLFTVGETITNNPLHVGINVVTDERIKDSMRELARKRGYCTNKDWMTFDDDLCGHKYAICSKHKNIACKQYIVDECEYLNDAINELNKWRHSGMMDYSYYMLDTDNNKVLDY